jgi:hypothetical protein
LVHGALVFNTGLRREFQSITEVLLRGGRNTWSGRARVCGEAASYGRGAILSTQSSER